MPYYPRQQAYKVLFLQLIVTFILFLAWSIYKNINTGTAVIFGGMAVVIPNWIFIKLLLTRKPRTPQKTIIYFYLGELIKIGLSVALLLLIFHMVPVKVIPLITGFIGAYIASWLAPFVIRAI